MNFNVFDCFQRAMGEFKLCLGTWSGPASNNKILQCTVKGNGFGPPQAISQFILNYFDFFSESTFVMQLDIMKKEPKLWRLLITLKGTLNSNQFLETSVCAGADKSYRCLDTDTLIVIIFALGCIIFGATSAGYFLKLIRTVS